MIKKYKSKPKIIEAVQFDGSNQDDICLMSDCFSYHLPTNTILFYTPVETIPINVGDYIEVSAFGEYFYSHKEAFEASCEEVTDD